MHTLPIERLVAEFEANPTLVRRSLQNSWGADPEKFFEKAVEVLCRPGHGVGHKFLVSFLIQHAHLTDRLSEPDAMTREEAISLARLAMRVDPSLDIKMAMKVAASSHGQQAGALRLLEILESVAHVGNLLPMLSHAIRHQDAKVRSKAALLMGKGNQNPSWVQQQLFEHDPRVRANAVESLWGLTSEEALQVFYSAAQDVHQRVVVNGVLGLYLAGSTQCVELFHELAGHPDAPFRASTAWGIGRSQDPRFLRLLTELARDSDGRVRANALRSTVRIRNFRSILQTSDSPVRVRLVSGKITSSGSRVLEIAVRQEGRPDLPALPPLAFCAEENGAPVLRFEVEPCRVVNNSVGIVFPAADDLEADARAALDNVLHRALKCKPDPEQWSVSVHTHRTSSSEDTQFAAGFHDSPARILRDRESASASPFAGFLPSLMALLHALPNAKGRRTLILCASPLPETTSIVLYRQHQIDTALQNLRQRGVQVQGIAPAGCPPLLRMALQQLCQATGGALHNAGNCEEAAQCLENLLMFSHPSCTMQYWGFPKSLREASVRLRIHCAEGCGEDTATISAGAE